MASSKNQVIAKAWKDPAFKKKLLSNPKEALQECGIKIPDHVNVKVIEDTTNSYTFVIPSQPKNVQQLSENELEKVAGGIELDAIGLAGDTERLA